MRRLCIALLAICIFAIFSPAQDSTLRPPPPATQHAPSLIAEDQNAHTSLALAKADIRVNITGYSAETTMTLTFKNDTPRALEGELEFPLPEDAVISGYGLDVNGQMVDGVPVAREKARIAYEKESRQRVDPGLVEQTVGNNFRTRVYPIPANGSRTIKVQYISDLLETPAGATCVLPLDWDQKVGQCTIRLEVATGAAQPIVAGSAKGLNLEFKKWENRFVAEQSLADVILDGNLAIAVPDVPRQSVLVEKHAGNTMRFDDLLRGHTSGTGAAEADSTRYYFTIYDHPDMRFNHRAEAARARHIGILWDAGLTRGESAKTREFKLLEKTLAGLDPAAAVDIIVFRNVPQTAQVFPAADGAEPILKYLRELVYDGATNLSLLEISRGAVEESRQSLAPSTYDYWLLFSDGLAALGADSPRVLEAPVYVVSNEARANHALLRRIAANSGGRYLNLQSMTDEQAASAIGPSAFSLLAIDAPPGALQEVFPKPGTPVDGRVTVSGLLKVPSARITLKYGVNGTVMTQSEFTLTRDGALETPDLGLVCRAWAQQKVADLSADAQANADALETLGREFNLVTPNTSLLVLETVDQYLAHRIVPPRSRGEVYAQFMTRIETQKAQIEKTREERLTQVVALWNGRAQWWDQKFEYVKNFKYAQLSEPVVTGGARGAAGGSDRQLAETPAREGHDQASPVPAPTVAAPAEHGRNMADASVRHLQVGNNPGAASDADDNAAVGNRVLSGLTAGAVLEDIPGKDETSGPAITIKPWDPAVPYLRPMREAGPQGAYAVFLKQRPQYASSPGFYLDCADYLLRNGQKDMGLRVLGDVAALKLENAQLLRVAAGRFAQEGEREMAIEIYQKVLKLRPEEPQSSRDLALALADRADAALLGAPSHDPLVIAKAQADYQRALDLLTMVIMGQWDNRFPEIQVPVLMEANRIIAIVSHLPGADQLTFHNPLDGRLVKLLDLDVRIVLDWDADLTDVDLWVIEPSGEKCVYNHNRTTIGGLLSHDITQGYGPEEYCLRQAMPGQYKIQANYFGSQQLSLAGPVTVRATVITHFGRPDEQHQTLTLRLDKQKDVVDVGSIVLNSDVATFLKQQAPTSPSFQEPLR